MKQNNKIDGAVCIRKLYAVLAVLLLLCIARADDVRADVSLPSWAGQATSTAAGVFNIPGFVSFCGVGSMAYSAAQGAVVKAIFGDDQGSTGAFMYLMPCLTDLIQDSADDFITDFYDEVAGLMQVFLTIAVLFFGIALSTGGIENVKRDGMVLVLKVGFVVGLTQNLSEILDLIYEIQDGLILAATGYVNTTSFLTSFNFLHCSAVLDVWMRADCLVNTVLGVHIPAFDKTTVTGLYSKITDPDTKITTSTLTEITSAAMSSKGSLDDGLLAFFLNCFMSGAALSLCAIIGLSMVFNILVGLLKAANVYLTSLIGLAFMAIAGGLLLPLMLMRSTYVYFSKWALALLSLMIQPIVLFVFLNVCLTAFDIVLISGQNSVLHLIAGKKVEEGYKDGGKEIAFNVNRYITENNAAKKAEGEDAKCLTANLTLDGVTKDSFAVGQKVGGNVGTPITTVAGKEGATADKPNDPRTYSMCVNYKMLDAAKLAQIRDPKVEVSDDYKPKYEATDTEDQKKKKDEAALASQFSAELVGGVVMAWLASYVFLAMLGMVPQLSRKLMGVG